MNENLDPTNQNYNPEELDLEKRQSQYNQDVESALKEHRCVKVLSDKQYDVVKSILDL